eukprot:COSAG02_NODE_5338_length_4423_cov_20.602220_1_plen_422_part_10
MVDMSALKSDIENNLCLEAIDGYMTVEQERTYRKAKELFDGTDQDGNGLLDKSEVRQLFESMNLEVTDAQHEKAFREMDDDCNGEVDFDEFHEWYANHQHSIEKIWKPRVNAVFTVQEGGEPRVLVDLKLPPWAVSKRPRSAKRMTLEEEREEALGLFREIDLDSSGGLDASEIKHLLEAMDVKLSDAEAAEATRTMGCNAKEEVDFESFFLWWQANQSRAASIKSKLMYKVKLRSRSMRRPPPKTVGTRPSTPLQTPASSPTKDVEEVQRFFKAVDTNGNGLLDREEVKELSRSLGSELTEEKLTEAMDSMDPKGQGVDYEKFSQWYGQNDQSLNIGTSIFKRGLLSYFRSPSIHEHRKTPSKTPPMDPGVMARIRSEQITHKQEEGRIEAELGLTGSPEEAAQIAKMQATVRGKQDRKKV